MGWTRIFHFWKPKEDGALFDDVIQNNQSEADFTTAETLQLSTVWACVKLISQTISTLPLKLYEKDDNGNKRLAKDHELYFLLCHSPNRDMTPARFWLFVSASLCLRGNAFVEIVRRKNKIVALMPLAPEKMMVKKDGGALSYIFQDGQEKREIKRCDMLHFRGFGLDGLVGLHPVNTGREIFGAAHSIDKTSAKLYANGLSASGFLTAEGFLTPDQRAKYHQNLRQFSGSRNAGKLMILEGGFKYQNISIDPQTAQLLQTRNFSIEEICRFFGVPPFFVGHMDKSSSWASSIEGQKELFLTSCLRPILCNLEEEMIKSLLQPAEYGRIFPEFNIEGLLRADSAGRAAFYHNALQNGWLSRNEVRRLENLPPIEGGDVYTIQLNLSNIQDFNQTDPEEQKK